MYNHNMSGLQHKYWVFMKSQLEQQSTLNTNNNQLSSSKKVVLLKQLQQSLASINEFFKDKCSWMVSANISWFKLQMSELHSFFKSTAYSRPFIIKTWCICYEVTDSVDCFTPYFVAGMLGIGVPSSLHLIYSKVLDHEKSFHCCKMHEWWT